MSNPYSLSKGFRASKHHRELRQRIIKHFNWDELYFLASDLSVDWDALVGETKHRKTHELIDHLSRRKELGKLIALIKQERPSVEWPGFPDGTVVDLRFEYEASGKTQEGILVEGEGRVECSHVIDGENLMMDLPLLKPFKQWRITFISFRWRKLVIGACQKSLFTFQSLTIQFIFPFPSKSRKSFKRIFHK